MQIHEHFKNSLNFRDLGGLQTNNNKTVKYKLFYRGAGLNFFDDKELEYFKALNIKTIMDLRSKQEITTYPDPIIENAHMIQHSGLVVKGSEDIDWSPTGMRKIGGEAFEQLNKIETYYKTIAFDNTAFKLMIKEIEKDNLPIYFHCATGKDRTGVAAMIILLMLDVKLEEIRKDYLITNEYRKEIINESLNRIEDTKIYPELKTLITMQDGVVEKVFDIVMNSILEKYDSYDDYLKYEFDLDEDKLIELRNKYTY